MSKFRRQFTTGAPEERRFETNYWIGIPDERLLEQVAHLPRETIVLFVTIFDDGTGRPFIPAQVAEDIAEASSAPVYTPSDSNLGRGIVGGYMDTYEAAGTAAADLALEVLGKIRTPSPRDRPMGTTGWTHGNSSAGNSPKRTFPRRSHFLT